MRSIVHLDADAFFASVEQASDPRLRGQPVAVGGEPRGIIASASYEARRFGVYTPMPTGRARKLCPRLIVLPGDFEKYEQFSRWMFSYAYDFTPEVEIRSIDEGYFDLTGARKPPAAIAETIRQAIRQSLKISVSEGLGSNKLVSQIASKLHKPAAFTEVPSGAEKTFLHPLPNHWLPGIGPKTATQLNAAGLAYIGQIAATPADLLELLLGRMAPSLKQFANGIDERPIVPASAPAQSYSQQETFAQDTTDEEYLEAWLRRMADRLMAKVRADGKSIRTLMVKVRYNDRAEDQASESLAEPTPLETDLYSRLPRLLRQAWRRRVSLRMVSLKLSNVYDAWVRMDLALDPETRQRAAQQRLAAVIDELRQRHGRQILRRGHDFFLDPPDPERRIRGQGSVVSSQRRGARGGILREVGPAYGGATPKPLPEPPATRHPPPVTRHPPPVTRHPPPVTRFVPLAVRSYYSFLDSTLSIEAIIRLAQEHQMPAIALADTGNLHGAVEFFQAARRAGIQPIIGATIRWQGKPLRLYVENPEGYRNLCRILSSDGADPRSSTLTGLIAAGSDPRLAGFFPGRFYLAVSGPEDLRRLAPVPALPRVACPDIRYAERADRWKYDVVQSIRTRTLLRQEHPDKDLTGEFHFRSPEELGEWFRTQPQLLANTREIAERCHFAMPLGPPQFPAFAPPDGSPLGGFLRRLVLAGLRERYPESQIAQLEAQIEDELALIHEVGYEEYFLVVWDLLQECRRRGIEWLTRGSAADSLVCYCLGISSVCPIRFGLYFRRFLNRERMQLHKLPDIDLDFPHDRKDDVMDLVLAKYGPEHAAVVGGFSTYRARGAVGDVAKVLGVSEHQIRQFTEHFPQAGPRGLRETLQVSQECRDLPWTEEPYSTALQMAEFLEGFPRYPKMHPCGVVLSRQPLAELTPTFRAPKGYPTTHFDMDAVEAIGLVKIDLLAQGGLAVMRDVKAALRQRGIEIDLDRLAGAGVSPGSSSRSGEPVSGNAWNDPAVWKMIAGGGARAVHHIESPAMIGLCRQSQVREIDGLIAIVSVIRPGAANEQKKLRFTRRYQGFEPVTYPDPSLAGCLADSFGLVIYEEHVLQIGEAFAGLPPGRADLLRRALGKNQRSVIEEIQAEFFAAARHRGHAEARIGEVWKLVEGFAGYAFCKAHSTAYGIEAYQSAWLKHYYPAEFMAAVLSNGKGFYHPLVYVLEGHRLGIPLLPPWINEPGPEFRVVSSSPLQEPFKGPPGFGVRQSSGALEHSQAHPKRSRCIGTALQNAVAWTPVPPGFMIPRPSQTSLETFPIPKSKIQNLKSPLPRLAIRVPVTRVKGLTDRTRDQLLRERQRGEFGSLADFYRRVAPLPEEMEALIRVGAFDDFGRTRTAQYWEFRFLYRTYGAGTEPSQGWLLPPPGSDRLPEAPLQEPRRQERLAGECDLLGFPASGHPLELYPGVAWETYCPVARLGDYRGETVVTCGLVIEQRIHHQITGEPMKFLTLADWTGIVETELFAPTYRSYGLATIRHPVLEVTATVEPFENQQGFSLRVHRAGKPRIKTKNGGDGVPPPSLFSSWR